MRRRSLVTGGVALAAAGGGAFWSMRQLGGPNAQDAGLWDVKLTTPVAGGEVALASLRGKPLLVNFWATWCPPCVKELPQLDRFHREFAPRGWQVLGIAIDSADAVREFLAKTPVGYPVGLGGLEGTTLARTLGNESGALPFSVLFDANGRLTHRKLGETHFEELADWAG